METGIRGEPMIIVTEQQTAKYLGSGELAVFATPCMIALMENTAYKSVQPFLDPGQGTVGTLLNVKHLAATPVGMEVRCETKVLVYGYIEHRDHLIKGIETGMLTVVFIIHDRAWRAVNNIGQLFLRHTAGFS